MMNSSRRQRGLPIAALVTAVILGTLAGDVITNAASAASVPSVTNTFQHGVRSALKTAHTSGTPLYTAGELYGGSNTVALCFTCEAANITGTAPPSESLDTGSGVDTLTGDYSYKLNLFDAPGIGADMSETLTYDAQLAQAEIAAAQSPGEFGYGWSSTWSTSVSPGGSGTEVVNEGSGAQVTFTEQNSGSCPTGDQSSYLRYTMTYSRDDWCALANVQAQFGDPNILEFQQGGGAQTGYYSYGGGFYYNSGSQIGNQVFANYPPGTNTGGSDSQTCPTTAQFCDALINQYDGRQILEVYNSGDQIVGIIAPSHITYNIGYDSHGNLVNISSNITGTGTSTWNFVYDTGAPSPNTSDLVQIYDPDSGVGSSPPVSAGAVHSNYIAYNNTGTDIGMVNEVEDGPGPSTSNGSITTYSYADPCSTGICVQPGNPQLTTVTYPPQVPCPSCTAVSPVEKVSYTSGVETQTSLGVFGSGAYSETWQYAWSMGYGVANSTETITYPNSLSGGTAPTAAVVLDPAGNVISTTNAAGDVATSAYNDTGSAVRPELLWSYPGYSSNPPSSPPSGSEVYTYDGYGNVLTETDPLGNVTKFGWYAYGNVPCYVEPPTVAAGSGAPTACPITYGYILSTVAPPVGSTVYQYDYQGDVTSTIVDYQDTGPGADLQTTTSSFDVMDDPLWTIPPPGQSGAQNSSNPYATVATYLPNRLVASVTRPSQGTTSYTYDLALNPTLVTMPAVDTSNVFDGDNRVCFTWTVNWAPGPTSCSHGNDGGTKAFTYVPGGSDVASVTDSNADVTNYYYGDMAYPNSPTEVVDGMGNAIQYSGYNDYGTPCEAGDVAIALNSSQCSTVTGDTKTVYNALGNETSITDPSGNVTTNTFANTQYPTAETSTTNALSATTSYQYDANGRLVTTTNPDSTVVTDGYDADSRLCVRANNGTTYTCGGGSGVSGVTGYTYNGANDRLSMTSYSPTAATTTYTYTTGELTSTTDSNAKTTSYLYNYAGQVQCTTYPVSSSATCGTLASPATASTTNTIVDRTYDSAGRLATVTDWLGHTTTYALASGWTPQSPTKITYPSSTGVTANYNYDNASNLITLTAGTTSTTSINDAWGHDADERVATPTMQGVTGSWTNYNANNQITLATNLATSTSNDTYTVAANGAITSDAAPSGSTTSFGYNAGSELCWRANVAASSSACGSPPAPAPLATSYSYTTNGQRASAATTTGAIAPVGTQQTGDSNGDATIAVNPQHVGDAIVLGVELMSSSVTVSSISGGGSTWRKLTSNSTGGVDNEFWLGTVATTGSSTITVTYSGSVSSDWIELSAQEYSNGFGASASWTTDTAGVTNTTSSSTTVALPSLSPSGSGELYVGMAFVSNTGAAGSTSGFTYDLMPGSNIFAYNPNVSSSVSPTATQSPSGTYNSIAVLLKANTPTTTTTHYAWNPYGELCNVSAATTACGTTPTSGTAYTYSGDGLRMTAATTSSTTDSTWDSVGGGSIPLNINDATTTGSTTTNVSYIYGDLLFGGTAPIEQITTTSSGATVIYLVANQTGVQGAYSSTGSPVELALYSTYGGQTVTSGSKVTPFGFQGSYLDSTGLMYLINRYYDPTTDQFMSIDPEVATTDQSFVYTNDDPLNQTDPLGLKGWYCDHGVNHYYTGNSHGPATGKCKPATNGSAPTTSPVNTKKPPATPTSAPVTEVPSQVALNQSNENQREWCQAATGFVGFAGMDAGAALGLGFVLAPETVGGSVFLAAAYVVTATGFALVLSASGAIPSFCPKG